MNFIKDGFWFGEQLASSLDKGGITRSELAQRWVTSDLEDDRRSFSRDVFRNIRQSAEELFGCNFICNKQTNRWKVEGNDTDEERFVRKVQALKEFMRLLHL